MNLLERLETLSVIAFLGAFHRSFRIADRIVWSLGHDPAFFDAADVFAAGFLAEVRLGVAFFSFRSLI